MPRPCPVTIYVDVHKTLFMNQGEFSYMKRHTFLVQRGCVVTDHIVRSLLRNFKDMRAMKFTEEGDWVLKNRTVGKKYRLDLASKADGRHLGYFLFNVGMNDLNVGIRMQP